ncbi:MAG TPA: CNNM domain-containing protein [Chthoniobacterales bacterium]|jgi:CBS domain containing-hemolysin-like protein|nr:CNNM domain-containing protein [Chthoniobacterales bacterium]
MRDFFIIAGCWAISFLFNGIEAGLTSIDPVRLRHHVKLNRPSAVRLDRLLKTPGHLLVTVLLVTNFADIVALLLLTRFLVSRFATTGFLLAILIALPIYLFVLVVLPKSLFRRFPFRALSPLARLLEISMTLLWPILATGTFTGRLFLPAQKKRARLFAAREELKQITSQSEREGSLTATERAMIHNVVDFQSVTAREVMKPLPNVATLKPDSAIEDVLSLSRSTGFDRLPVIGANGDAVGLINVLDILLDKDQPQSLSRYLRRMVTVQESEPASRAVRRLRAARLDLAAVVDQKRNLIGVVTSEDLVARLVRA